MDGESLTTLRFRVQADVEAAADAVEATERAYALVDTWIAAAPGRARWACEEGCAACCRLLVRLSETEADALVAHLGATVSDEALHALVERAALIAVRVEKMGARAYRRARIRCALLTGDDLCAAYARRPVVCRVHASTSATACASPEGPVPFDTWLAKVGAAARTGLAAGEGVELHAALASRLR